MGKKSEKIPVPLFFMSIHYGICAGPVDSLLALYFGEKDGWAGDVSDYTAIPIDLPNLFGGLKKEGGVQGVAHYLPGGVDQILPDALAARFGLTGLNCPGFRGISSVFMVGKSTVAAPTPIAGVLSSGIPGSRGFYWSANTPYLKGMWAKVRRYAKGLDAGLSAIGNETNPAHIIYECLTNTDWGMGASSSIIDVASFNSAAEVLVDEVFGLSMIWTRQSTIESFINEVIDHIQATLYASPRTGLLTLKLVRGDYNEADLPIINPDNAILNNFQRKAWGETVNEIVTTWTNPANEQEETVTMQDLGNITMQGDVISDSRNYYGIRNAELAARVTARDLRMAAAPLSSCEVQVDRMAWDWVPGDLFKLVWPDEGVNGVVMRIGNLKYGKAGDPTIRINAVEDIFALNASAYTIPPGSAWVDPSSDPQPMTHVEIITMNAYFAANNLSVGDAEAVTYPEVYAGVLAAQGDEDTSSFDLYREEPQPNGDMVWTNQGTKTLAGRGLLVTALPEEAASNVVTLPNPSRGSGPEVAGLIAIGTGGDEGMELALIQSYDISTGWLLHRGVLDTIPRAWPVGTPVWYLGQNLNFADPDILTAGQYVEYKLLTQTSRGILALDDAPVESAVLTGRPHLPLRPANTKINNDAWGSVSLPAASVFIPVTWSNRNRVTETSQILRWDDGGVTPEVGQETVLQTYATNGDFLQEYVAPEGDESYNIPKTDLGGRTAFDVVILSRRDGLESLQNMKRRVNIV